MAIDVRSWILLLSPIPEVSTEVVVQEDEDEHDELQVAYFSSSLSSS